MSHSGCACLSVCVSVLPSSLSEAAAALQSGGHASHPQENLQGTVRLSLRRLNDQLTSVLDCCLRVFFWYRLRPCGPDKHGHWRTQSVTQTNMVWLPCFPRMPQSLSLWTLDTESRDAVTRLCWHSTASQSECFFLLFFFFNANLKRTTDVAPYWPPAKNAGPEHFCFDFEFCHQTSREFQPQQLVFDWGCRRWSGLDQKRATLSPWWSGLFSQSGLFELEDFENSFMLDSQQ